MAFVEGIVPCGFSMSYKYDSLLFNIVAIFVVLEKGLGIWLLGPGFIMTKDEIGNALNSQFELVYCCRKVKDEEANHCQDEWARK
jgi:hypothetical protein